jgi:hypothetical protein
MDRRRSTHELGKKLTLYKLLHGKRKGEKYRWKNNIKMDHIEIVYEFR